MFVVHENDFKEIIEEMFNRWTALKLAVEHGMGGRTGQQTARDLVIYVTSFCLQTKNVSTEDVEEILEDIMDQEFETICEDNSVKEISRWIIKYFNMCKEGRLLEVKAEISQLPDCVRWLRIDADNVVNINEIETEEIEMEVQSPSCSGSTTKMLEENIDPEWTTVTSKRRK